MVTAGRLVRRGAGERRLLESSGGNKSEVGVGDPVDSDDADGELAAGEDKAFGETEQLATAVGPAPVVCGVPRVSEWVRMRAGDSTAGFGWGSIDAGLEDGLESE